jgi:hypothetical protein
LEQSAEIPYEVTALLRRALPSMVHIEVLLLLARDPARSWSAAAAATEVHSTPELAAAALADLHAARLVVPEGEGQPPSYRIDQRDELATSAVASLREMYERRPVTLIRAVYERPPSAVKAFADAFRVRPPEER